MDLPCKSCGPPVVFHFLTTCLDHIDVFFLIISLTAVFLSIFQLLLLLLSACGPPASFSVHLASSTVNPAGYVHKSRGDNVVRMWVQLKRFCIDVCCVCECYKEGIMVIDVIWHRLCVSMI